MKKAVSFLFVLILACSLSCPTLAYTDQKQISVYIDNQPLAFDVAPIIENGRTLVPMRAIFEALNVTVDWEESTQTVTARTEYLLCMELQIGNPIAKKYFRSPSDDFNYETNEGTYQIDQLQNITLDAAPKIVANRTMIPLRFIAESMNYEVRWDAVKFRVDIIRSDEGSTSSSVGYNAQLLKEDASLLLSLDELKEATNCSVYEYDAAVFGWIARSPLYPNNEWIISNPADQFPTGDSVVIGIRYLDKSEWDYDECFFSGQDYQIIDTYFDGQVSDTLTYNEKDDTFTAVVYDGNCGCYQLVFTAYRGSSLKSMTKLLIL